MEFKEFKNSTGKVLKEYWITPSEWDALDKATVQEGDIYHIVGTIDKGDLSAGVNASLAKGDSSLQKPTATLAKESFVKVGIDGTQKFDESSYVVAPSTDGTAGQVLKKTATGTEWANESGSGSLVKTSIKLNLSEFTFDESTQKFTLSQNAANIVSQIIQKQFETKGFCIAFLDVGGTLLASYQINFSNIASGNIAYLSFSNPLYTSEELSTNFNVLIKPTISAQRVCSDTSLFNRFVEYLGVLEFVLYS